MDVDAERLGDLAEARQARARVAGGLVALDLLLLEPRPRGQRLLREAGGQAGADQPLRQPAKRITLEAADLAAPQRFVFGELPAQHLDLALDAFLQHLLEHWLAIALPAAKLFKRCLEIPQCCGRNLVLP